MLPEACTFGIYNRGGCQDHSPPVYKLQFPRGNREVIFPVPNPVSSVQRQTQTGFIFSIHSSKVPQCQNKHQLWIFIHYQELRSRDTFLQQERNLKKIIRKKALLLLILHVVSTKKHKITQCKAWRQSSA